MKIFFALENSDRYCLKIDFPHEGAEYLHLNLHELIDRQQFHLIISNIVC